MKKGPQGLELPADRVSEVLVGFGDPTLAKDTDSILAVGVDDKVGVSPRTEPKARLGQLECQPDGPQLPDVVAAGPRAAMDSAPCKPGASLSRMRAPAPQGPGLGFAEPSVKAVRLVGGARARDARAKSRAADFWASVRLPALPKPAFFFPRHRRPRYSREADRTRRLTAVPSSGEVLRVPK